MPRKLELTFFKSKKQWKRKKYGKVHYLGHGDSRYDMASYQLALTKWRNLESELDKEHRAAVDPRTPQQKAADSWWEERPLRGVSEAGRAVVLDRQARKQPAEDGAPTVAKMLQRFIERKRKQAGSEQRSAGRFINLKMYAEQFADFVGRDEPVAAVNSIALMDYHSKALADIAAGRITGWCGRDRMQVARQLIVFLWEMGQIELPRNVRSRDLDIVCSAPKIDVFETGRLREIIEQAPEKLRLWLLLMANCGMTQKDVSDLRPEQIDWAKGTITRKRSKTRNFENVPIVTYTLWPTTLELLRKHRRSKSRVFSNANGSPLAGSKLTAKGGKFDVIGRTYNGFLEAKKIKDGTLKAIRKTSASKIGEHAEYGKFSQYFLGQAARTVADRHYVRPTNHRCTTIEWLCEDPDPEEWTEGDSVYWNELHHWKRRDPWTLEERQLSERLEAKLGRLKARGAYPFGPWTD